MKRKRRWLKGLALAGICIAIPVAVVYAETFSNLTVNGTSNFRGSVNVLDSNLVRVIGGSVLVRNPTDANERFSIHHAGISSFRSGGMVLDNRAIGADTVFRTSKTADRDTFALRLHADGRVVTRNDLLVTNGANAHIAGEVSAAVVEIRGEGNDLAEAFKVNSHGVEVEPGMVVAIDADNPGELRISDKPYDRTVVGIVSGAGDKHVGIQLGHADEVAQGLLTPVALTGRVWCYVDGSYGAVAPGDFLTTSPTLGHAMVAQDFEQSRGAVIGKAMTPLTAGETGLVLVLVNLQ